MTNSKSSKWLIVLALLAGWLLIPASANAGGRKRVVVLELEGPKAEKFHGDLVKLIKKSHNIVPIEKWNSTAEELDASGASDKNIKKVAKKLKIDVIVQGKIEKRRDEYIIQLRIREGKSGSIVGNRIDTKAEGPRIDGSAASDLKDELIPAIDSASSNRGGGNDDEEEDEDKPAKKKVTKKDDAEEEDEDKPAKKKVSKKDDEEDEDKPAKKKASKKDDAEEEDEDKPAKKGFSRKNDDETNESRTKKDGEDKPAKKGFSRKNDDEEEETPLPKAKKVTKKDKDEGEDEEDEDKAAKKKKVAKKDDGEEDEEGGDVEKSSDEEEDVAGADMLSPGERAVDAVVGLSLNARRLAFTYEPGLTNKPKPYKGVPVAGVLIDATIYPLSIGHKRHDILRGLGATFTYDKVIKINSKQGTTTLPTSQSHYAFGAAFRYPYGKFVVGGTLRYGRQAFTIGSAGGVVSELPNVNYTIIDPSVFLHYTITPKIVANATFGYMAFLNTGAIQKNDAYGAATVTGFELEIGGDYLLTKNIFARASFRMESIGFKFKGTGTMSTMLDADMEQDVFGASDKYIGGAATVGYLY